VNKGIKKRYFLKVIISLLASLLCKRLQISIDMLPMTTSPSDKLFSHINIDDFERP